ncbi:MAG: hypothetical protein ACOYL5_13560 [Phototrophicaceae bacterium]
MPENIQDGRAWLWLTVPMVVLGLLMSGVGLSVPDFYSGAPTWTIQAVAQDFFDLVIVLPVLIVSAAFAYRGSQRARLIWLGALSYLVYSMVIYTFALYFNALFLVYVAALGCSLWALIGGMATTQWHTLKMRFAPNTPVKAISVLLLIQVALFYVTWLREDIPALLAGTIPATVLESGLPTNPVHVLDMAVMLPAIAFAAVALWRRQAQGYGVVPVVLTNAIFQTLNITGIMIFSLRAGLPAATELISVFVALAAIDLALLVWHLSHMNAPVGFTAGQTAVQPSVL